MDHPGQMRLKVSGYMKAFEIGERQDQRCRLGSPGYGARIDPAVQVTVEAFD